MPSFCKEDAEVCIKRSNSSRLGRVVYPPHGNFHEKPFVAAHGDFASQKRCTCSAATVPSQGLRLNWECVNDLNPEAMRPDLSSFLFYDLTGNHTQPYGRAAVASPQLACVAYVSGTNRF